MKNNIFYHNHDSDEVRRQLHKIYRHHVQIDRDIFDVQACILTFGKLHSKMTINGLPRDLLFCKRWTWYQDDQDDWFDTFDDYDILDVVDLYFRDKTDALMYKLRFG